MRTNAKKILGVATSAFMVTSLGATAGMAYAEDVQPQSDGIAASDALTLSDATQRVKTDAVEGSFAFTQDSMSTRESVVQTLAASATYLCGSVYGEMAPAQAAGGAIVVGGAVASPYAATLEEMAQTGAAQIKMGCACAGNPAGGTASINAEVAGVTLDSIVEAARPAQEVNTIVFTSSDGYEVALPYNYVMQRYSLIAYAVNGEELPDLTGGMNQLWLGSTSARYYARDVTAITFESRQTPPPAPGTEEAGDIYANIPNIGVSGAEEAA